MSMKSWRHALRADRKRVQRNRSAGFPLNTTIFSKHVRNNSFSCERLEYLIWCRGRRLCSGCLWWWSFVVVCNRLWKLWKLWNYLSQHGMEGNPKPHGPWLPWPWARG